MSEVNIKVGENGGCDVSSREDDIYLKLFSEYQSLRKYETDKLRESARFFESIAIAFVIGSIIVIPELDIYVTLLPLSYFLPLFAIVISFIGIYDLKRCYMRFLRWILILHIIEKKLKVFERFSDKELKTEALGELERSFEENEKMLATLRGDSKKKLWSVFSFLFDIYFWKKSTLLKTYTMTFLFLIFIASFTIILRIIFVISAW